MEKVFYSDHYHVNILWDLDEQLVNGEPLTTVKIQCELIFQKNIPIVKKKIKDYYDSNLMSSFDKYLRPQLENWI